MKNNSSMHALMDFIVSMYYNFLVFIVLQTSIILCAMCLNMICKQWILIYLNSYIMFLLLLEWHLQRENDLCLLNAVEWCIIYDILTHFHLTNPQYSSSLDPRSQICVCGVLVPVFDHRFIITKTIMNTKFSLLTFD